VSGGAAAFLDEGRCRLAIGGVGQEKVMGERTCYNCLYGRCDPGLWLRAQWAGAEPVPRCANDPRQPGVLHEVTGVPCRNYQPRPPEPTDGVRRIPLGGGHYALVDAEDFEWLNQWRWYLGNGYAIRMEKGKIISMHRQIMQPPKRMLVDHINHQKEDNRRVNLRVCTRLENMYNRSKRRGSVSRFNGVTYKKSQRKWVGTVWFRGKVIWSAYFNDEIEAARAYDRKAVEMFGQYANVNFPEDWPPERRREIHAESARTAESSFARRSNARTSSAPQKPNAKTAEKKARRNTGCRKKPKTTKSRR
jgi:hypothetical protein